MGKADEYIFIVDSDREARSRHRRILDAPGRRIETYETPADFLKREPEDVVGCLLLEASHPDGDGLELQRQLQERQIDLTVVFVSADASVPESVTAMKQGAVDFLQKPVNKAALLIAVEDALRLSRQEQEVKERLRPLTPREREVMELVIAGLPNKEIATALGITEPTVKVHRSRVMDKLSVGSVPELVRLCERAGVKPGQSS